jgi:hypothetical protein
MEETRTDIRDNNGRWLAPPPGSDKTRITTANARSMAQKRWEKYRQAAVRQIVGEAQSIDPSIQTPADAFGLVAAKQFTALMDTDRPKIADLEKLGQIMTGISEEPRRENAGGGENSISGSPEALMRLVELLEAERTAAVDRARAIDVTPTAADE